MESDLKNKAQQKGYGTLRRHIFLCTGDRCAPQETNLQLWDYLKSKLAAHEPDTAKATVARSKTECLRLCAGGPVAVIYPEGVIYHELNREKLDKIIEQHLLAGETVQELALLQMKLQP